MVTKFYKENIKMRKIKVKRIVCLILSFVCCLLFCVGCGEVSSNSTSSNGHYYTTNYSNVSNMRIIVFSSVSEANKWLSTNSKKIIDVQIDYYGTGSPNYVDRIYIIYVD